MDVESNQQPADGEDYPGFTVVHGDREEIGFVALPGAGGRGA
jgi:hypothetical protein